MVTGWGRAHRETGISKTWPENLQERCWKLFFSVWFVYLSLVIYLVFPERSLGGDFNIVKFVEML